MLNFLCPLIGHQRSKRRTRPWHNSWQSECILCATRLARVRHGQWVPVSSLASRGDMRPGRQAEPAD